MLNIREGDIFSTLRRPPNLITGTATAKPGTINVCSGTSSDYTVTLPPVAECPFQPIGFRMAPLASLSKLVTLDGNGSETIDGATTRLMWAGETAFLISDGVAWYKIGGRPIPMQCVLYLDSVQSGVATAVDTLVAVNVAQVDNTGVMASLGNNRIIIRRASTYFIFGTATMNSLTTAAVRVHSSSFLNGAAFGPLSETSESGAGANAAYTSAIIAFEAPLAVSDYVQLYGFHNTGVTEGFRGAAFNSSPSQIGVSEKITW